MKDKIRGSTKRHLAEAAARLSEERLRRAFENIPDVIVIYDRELRIQYINAATRRISGRTEADFIGKRDDEIWPPEVYGSYLPVLREALATGTIRSLEVDLELAGKPRRLLITCVPLIGEDGNVREILGITHDLTDQVKSENEIRENRELFRAIFDYAGIGIALADPDVRYLRVNRRLCEILGRPESEILGHHYREFTHPDDLAGDEALMQRLVAGEIPFFHLEKRYLRPDGSVVWVNLTVSQLTMGKSQIALAMVDDITDRRQAEMAEKKFIQAQKMESVGRLAGGVAHDFNNLLTVIANCAELCAMELMPADPLAENISEIRKAAGRAADLTRQLLAFSRQQIIQPKVIDLNEILANFAKMLIRVIGEDIELAIGKTPGLRMVRVDPGQIEQVIMNLAVNARDAMPDGGRLTITMANAECDPDCPRREHAPTSTRIVRIMVTDTGCGMNQETQARIFEPFFTTKAIGKGTGLGLATVYGIVEQNNGHVSVKSAPGSGTTFIICLPSVDGKAEPGTKTLPVAVTAPGAGTVLLVEDEAAILKIAQRVLEHAGYQVLTAANGAAALKVAKAHAGPIVLLITDVVMPGMTGPELAKRIKAARPEIRILYTSGYAEDGVFRQNVLEPNAAFLPKPYSIDTLTRMAQAILSQ